ncbi:hypothetical protein Rhopal_003509-T1 [Rhodotorula paludigena]|uniref:WD40 repeat-like protein n=1 Tax=Rhodotorula paludigena TaxID=86838 RepID=A0AAV5GJV0_9BASI|nr:hypothetical protein Rhopal_003509-T1 [Rhodotorula paludigena]
MHADPFSTNFPENFDTSIDADGTVAVLDFETKNIVRWLEGHVKAITALCWSSNSRYLLTASRDWNVIVWDLSASASETVEGERRHTIRFDAPVTSAALHPQNSQLVIVTLHGQTQPVLVDLRDGGGRWELEPPNDDEQQEDNDGEEETQIIRDVATIARFNPRGDLIYVGTSRGNIHIFDVFEKEWLWTEYVGSASAVKHLEFNNTGTAIVLNSNDRCIRYITLSPTPPEPPSDEEEAAEFELPPDRPPRIPYFDVRHRFQDLVNRTPWNGCGFSSDGEYIIGGAGHKAAHNIYIWDRETGGLAKILEGPTDPCEDLTWHPLRPLIASVSSLGMIHLWVTPTVENWSAYAPGFEELDENREYEEKEDEFDFEDETAVRRRAAGAQDESVDILSHTTSGPRAIVHEAWPEEYDPAPLMEWLAIEQDRESDGSEAFYPQPVLLDVEDVLVDEAAEAGPGRGR